MFSVPGKFLKPPRPARTSVPAAWPSVSAPSSGTPGELLRLVKQLAEHDDENAERDIRRLQQDIRELRSLLDDALGRVRQLEAEHAADVRREAWELREAGERARGQS